MEQQCRLVRLVFNFSYFVYRVVVQNASSIDPVIAAINLDIFLDFFQLYKMG